MAAINCKLFVLIALIIKFVKISIFHTTYIDAWPVLNGVVTANDFGKLDVRRCVLSYPGIRMQV